MWKRKISIKEQYGSFKHFWKGDEDCHYIGQRYMENTNIFARREWRGAEGTAIAFSAWLFAWIRMSSLALRNPVRVVKAFWRYRWLTSFLTVPAMVDRWIEGDRGEVLKADLTCMDCMVADSVDTLWKIIRADNHLGPNKWHDTTIPIDYTLPKHFIFGFPGYSAINIQQHAAFMQPLLRKNLGGYYLDQAVSVGIPGDMCTLPLVETGVAVEGEYPDIGAFWIMGNTPCDANIMDNNAMYRQLSNNGTKPVHAFTAPLMFDDPTTKELGVHEIYETIRFAEEQTGLEFAWEPFIEHLKRSNRVNSEELERWDIAATTNNACINPTVQALYRIYFFEQGGTKYFYKSSHKVMKYFYRAVRKRTNTFPYARHRAVAWSCGSTYYTHASVWLYNCWGILCVMNMDSLTGHNLIDLDSRDDMMEDLADWYSHTPMRTQTVGGNRHLMQVWETAEKFNCDMVVMYDDVGCKGMAGAQGLIEEEMNKHRDKYHILWMPHSLMDPRIVPPAEARRAVNQYMTTVMHEDPVDPTLMEFDDSQGW